MQLSISFHPFHRFSKTYNRFGGMEKVLSPSQWRLSYLVTEHYGISKSCDSPSHRIQQRIFSFRRVVKVKINIHKQLFNTKAVDLWECIRGLFGGTVADMTRASHQNNIAILLLCSRNLNYNQFWIINLNYSAQHLQRCCPHLAGHTYPTKHHILT